MVIDQIFQIRHAQSDYDRVKKEHDSWEGDLRMARREVASLTDKLGEIEAESAKANVC